MPRCRPRGQPGVALALVAVLAGAACGGKTATALYVVMSWDRDEVGVVDQVELTVLDATPTVIVGPELRPEIAEELPNPVDVYVYLRDEMAGLTLRCEVRAFSQGVEIARGLEYRQVRKSAQTRVEITLRRAVSSPPEPQVDGGRRDAGDAGDAAGSLKDGGGNPDVPVMPSLRNLGEACAVNSECRSNFCVDRVCCQEACGACRACNLPGQPGMCRPVAPGVRDPRALCRDQGATSCGNSGQCDGLGACAKYAQGTICRPPSCMSPTVQLTAGLCDGKGACQESAQLPCEPYACRANACTTTCTSNEECAPGRACDAMKSCGKRGRGQACTDAADCESGYCVDEVCCEDACAGPCRSCRAGATPGTCTLTPVAGPDPRGMCTNQGANTCGTDGTCNGLGACRRYPAGEPCSPGACNTTTNTRTFPSTCDGSGRCVPGQMAACGAFRCIGTTCVITCTSDADCVPPNTCNSGSCGLKPSGAMCTRNSECSPPLTCIGNVCQLRPLGNACAANIECASGFCTEGVCCQSADCGRCRSCKLTGFLGYCRNLAAGTTEPRSLCGPDPLTTCGRDGKCDGAGACSMHAAGTECQAGACMGSVRVKPRTCDGLGACVDNGTTECAPFLCNPATTTCYTTCVDKDQCAQQRPCANNSCI